MSRALRTRTLRAGKRHRKKAKRGRVVQILPNGTRRIFRTHGSGFPAEALKTQEWLEDYAGYLLSPEWQKIRQRILDRDKRCRDCQSKIQLQVHHLTYERIGQELLTDLVTLCDDCHKIRHGL